MENTPDASPSQGPNADGGDTSPYVAGDLDGERILVPLLYPEEPAITDQVRIGTSLARTTGAALHVINPVSVPDRVPTAFRHPVADDDDEELLEWSLQQTSALMAHLEGNLLSGRSLVNEVLQTVETHDVDTLVLPGRPPGGLLRRDVTERIATHADCDVLVVNGQSGYDSVASILLPVAGGPHSGLAADVARRIAEECGAWIDVLHVVDEDASARERDAADELVDATYNRIARSGKTSRWMLDADDVEAAIIEQSRYYGLTVIGAPTKGRLRRFVYGSTSRTVREKAHSVVLSARNNSSSSRPTRG